LTRASILLRKNLFKIDCRAKPGNDGYVYPLDLDIFS
jgi:hypothetical protein